MNRRHVIHNICNSTGNIVKSGAAWQYRSIKHQSCDHDAENFETNNLQTPRRSPLLQSLLKWVSKGPKRNVRIPERHFSSNTDNNPSMDREFFVQLWVADTEIKIAREKLRSRNVKYLRSPENENQRHFSATSMPKGYHFDPAKRGLTQPPTSQSTAEYLEPGSVDEVRIAPILARSNLLITRDLEWANLALGIEQESRYAIVDVCYPQSPVGFIREQSNFLARQLLRLRRPFAASITDAMGNELFGVRRPFWWITSSIYAKIDGKEIGVVHRRWHLWKRMYDLYLGNEQFAVVENPGFWNWTFTLKDINGDVLAEIDRNWRGFGFELLTDAGQYVIRFGKTDPSLKTGLASEIQELKVVRPLSLSERAVTVALAITLDSDYFSRHGGWTIPFIRVDE